MRRATGSTWPGPTSRPSRWDRPSPAWRRLLFVARENILEPTIGYQQGLLAFAAAVLGGIGRVGGAYLGGLVIGAVLSFLPLVSVEPVVVLLMPGALPYLPSLASPTGASAAST